jgi:hypothetical protein
LRDRADVAIDGSKISFRLQRGYARKSIKSEKLPTQNPEDPHYFFSSNSGLFRDIDDILKKDKLSA